ncbi:two-component system sensor histidine kinase NtrB [Stakelama saccharophila]|uniref:histidine kinase n=1 Tax=Stakelama saccharophila TaxID=3075605 RepID=A0ABZ0B6A5_9SPHN|nr:ATP-binding protein [Stakelama sp. W311]WNO52540.1 ATP-binding protein [Stakelama sp. W311]
MAQQSSGLTPAGAGAASDAGPGAADIVSALPVALLLIDPEDRIARANTACEHLMNMSERAMIGQRLDSILAPPAGYADRRPELGFAAFDADIRLARGNTIKIDFVESLMAEHDGWRIVTLHHAPGGRRPGYGIDRSAGARAAVGAAAMLAHEIKNPLSGIRGAAQLVAAGADDADAMTSLITSEVDRIAALIDRMEDFTDTSPLDLRRANIYPLLAHVRRVAEAGFARDIPIDEQFDPSLPDVLIDRDAFQQVLLNLLKNASEAVAGIEDGRITIATAYRHGMSVSAGAGSPRRPLPLEIAILDNGPGAPEDIVDHLFEPFVSGRPEGKGLGLPLVEKLARDMGGMVQYSREAHGGTPMSVFRLFLPRATG